MTITSTVVRTLTAAAAGATVIPTGFKVQRNEDVAVYLMPTGGAFSKLTYGTHYAVSNLDEISANITLVTAALAGDLYLCVSVVAPLQDLNLRNAGAYFPETLELGGLDRLERQIQQLYAIVSPIDPSMARVPVLGIGDSIGSGAFDGLSNRLANLDDATGQQDAVTLKQMQAAVAGVVGGGSSAARVIVTAATLPVAGILYDWAATGVDYIVRDAAFPDVIKRCLRLSTGNTYDWFVVVQGDR